MHSFIYENRRGTNEGIKWDVGTYYNEAPWTWGDGPLFTRRYLLPREASLGETARLVTLKGGILFKFASLTERQNYLWTALVIPIDATARVNEEISIPYSIIPILGLRLL